MSGLRAGAAYVDIHGRLARDFDRNIEREGSSRLGGVGSKLGGVLAKGMAGAGVIAGAALVKGLTDAIGNEQATDKVAASYGLDPATQERLGSVAGRLYADAYGDSLGQVADAAANVQRTLGELTDTEVEGLTANALDFAATFDKDVNEAISNAGILLKNGLAHDGQEAFDLLTVAMQRTAPAVRDEVLAATQEYSTFFADLGISGSEAFGLITRAAEKGGNYGVDKVGDALKELTIRSTDMSEASREAYWRAGLSATEMSERFLAGGDTARGALDDLVVGLKGIDDPVERANAAIGLFGVPLEDLSVSEVPAFLDQLQNMGRGLGDTEGAAEKMGDTLNTNLGTRLETLKRGALTRLAGFMENQVLPTLDKLGPVVERGVAVLAEKWPQVQAAVLPIVERVVGFIEQKWPQIEKIIEQGMETVTEVVSTALELVTVLWDNFGTYIVEFLQSSFDAIMKIVGGALDVIQGILDVVLGIITGDWSRAWEGLQQILSGAWDIIVGLFEFGLARARLVIQVALDIVEGIFTGALDAVESTVSGGIESVVGFFSGLGGRIARTAGDVFGFLWESFKGAINLVIRGWNRLEFKIPGFDPPGPGPKFGGFTLGLPDVPLLAGGGTAVRSGLSIVGDGGQPELHALSRGASVVPLDVAGMIAGAALEGRASGPLIAVEKIETSGQRDPEATARAQVHELNKLALGLVRG